MIKFNITFFIIFNIVSAFAQQPKGFDKQGCMFRNTLSAAKYVLIDSADIPQGVTVTRVTLKRSLPTLPQTDLTIQVYNVFCNHHDLAVFSVMPSLLSQNPVWGKINIDTIKKSLITLNGLHELMKNEFDAPSLGEINSLKRLKYHKFILVIKKSDGYYCNTTDCFTEFFRIISKPNVTANRYYEINPASKMLSIAEYEAAYKRKHGDYSSNHRGTQFSENINPALYLSYIDHIDNKNLYHFWLLDSWAIGTLNMQRGIDRFVFDPEVGVVAASFDFFMPIISSYWMHKDTPIRIMKGSAEEKQLIKTTSSFQDYNQSLFDYLTEAVIPNISIKNIGKR